MPITGPSIQVKADTKLSDVRAFLENNGINKGAKILGKYDATSQTTTLYIKSGPRTLKERVTGEYTNRKADAKRAFGDMATNLVNKTKSEKILTKGDHNKIKDIAGTVNARLNNIGDKSIKAGQLWLMAATAESVETLGKNHVASKDGPKRSEVKNLAPEVRQTAGELQKIIQNKGSVDTEAAKLGDKIATKFLAQHKGPINRLNFATSTGEAFKAAMLREMAKAVGGDEGKALAKDPKAIELVNKAYDIAASKILPNEELSTQTKQIDIGGNKVDLPFIKIGKTTYEPVKHLGTGGFAEVYEYKATDGSNKSIAYKISNANDKVNQSGSLANDPIKEIGQEVRAHRQMVGKGNDNVIGLVGAVRTPDGRLGIAMELADGAPLNDFSVNLKAAVGTGTGKISSKMADLVKLTLMQDMAKGLAHIQEKQGMLHLDFKSPNVLIGKDGKAKIADFGLSRKGKEEDVKNIALPDNPTWEAPEVLAGKRKLADISDLKTPGLQQKVKEIKEDLERFFKSMRGDTYLLGQQTSHILKRTATEERENTEAKISNKADSWSFGVAVIDLFRADIQFSNISFMDSIEEKLANFFNNPGGTAIADTTDQTQVGPTQLFASTGNKTVDKLLNDTVLQSDPDDRPTMSDFAKNKIFDTPGVGSKEVRNLIKALSSGDANQIDRAKRQLQGVMV